GLLRERTWAEVRSVDAGTAFAPEFSAERVPSLAGVCAWAKRASAGLSIELKQPWPGEGKPSDDGLAAAAVEELERSGLVGRVILHFLDLTKISQVRMLLPSACNDLSYNGPY